MAYADYDIFTHISYTTAEEMCKQLWKSDLIYLDSDYPDFMTELNEIVDDAMYNGLFDSIAEKVAYKYAKQHSDYVVDSLKDKYDLYEEYDRDYFSNTPKNIEETAKIYMSDWLKDNMEKIRKETRNNLLFCIGEGFC